MLFPVIMLSFMCPEMCSKRAHSMAFWGLKWWCLTYAIPIPSLSILQVDLLRVALNVSVVCVLLQDISNLTDGARAPASILSSGISDISLGFVWTRFVRNPQLGSLALLLDFLFELYSKTQGPMKISWWDMRKDIGTLFQSNQLPCLAVVTLFCLKLFAAHVVIETLLMALGIPYKYQLEMSCDLPGTILAHLGYVPKCLSCSLSLLPDPFWFEPQHRWDCHTSPNGASFIYE